MDLSVVRELIVRYPAALRQQVVDGLSYRGGWKPSEDDPTTPVPLTCRKPAHRAHPTYSRVENPVLDPQGNPTGQTQIIETYQPTRQELAYEVAAELIYTNAQRGCVEKEQEELAKAKSQIDEQNLITIEPHVAHADK